MKISHILAVAIYLILFISHGFSPYNGYSAPDRTGTSTGLPTPSCVFFAPPPCPCCIYLFPPDCDYMPVFVGIFGGRARQLSSSLAS